MTNSKELVNRIKGAGYTLEEVANILGITRQAFDCKIYNRENASGNKAEFKQGEIATLSRLLRLNKTAMNLIFFDMK